MTAQQYGSSVHTEVAHGVHSALSAAPAMHTSCAQVLPPVPVLLPVPVVTGQVSPQYWGTSLTHCASHSVLQQKASAAQSLATQGSQVVAIVSPTSQTSWQGPVVPPPVPPPTPVLVTPVLPPPPPVPPPTPVLPLVSAHRPPAVQSLSSGQATVGEHSAQRLELQALGPPQALTSASVQVTHRLDSVSQT